MDDKQKKYLIGGVVGLVVVIAIGFFYYNFVISNTKVAVNQQNTTPPSQGSGGTGQTQTPITTEPPARPTPLVLHSDSSNPYAVNQPRGKEPAQQTLVTFSPSDQQYNDAVKAGLIGSTSTGVNASGMTQSMANQYADLTSLTEQQIMSKYTPNYAQVNQTFSPSSTTATGDGVAVAAADESATSVPESPVPAGVSFNTTENNSAQAMADYTNQLTNTLNTLDIVNNPALVTAALTDASTNPQKFQANLAAAKSTLTQLQTLPVPSSMLGLQEADYNLYNNYVTYMQDVSNMQSAIAKDNATELQSSGSQLQQDVATFGNSLETSLENSDTAKTIISSQQAAEAASASS